MQDLDTLYTDATCYESEMRYSTDPKLLWEGIEKSYETMCELSRRLEFSQACSMVYERSPIQEDHTQIICQVALFSMTHIGTHTASDAEFAL